MSHTAAFPDRRQGLAAMIGLLVLSVALRPAIVSIGPVLLLIQQHFHLSFTQAALLTSIPDVCMGVLALLAPNLARRFGTDRCVVAALLLLGVATLMRALSQDTWSLLGSTLLVGVGTAIAGALIGGWVKAHFPQRAALFMGLFAAGLSLGATLAAVLTAPMVEWTQSWRVGAGMWAILCLTAVLSWMWMARRFASTGQPASSTPQRAGLPWRQAQAWAVAINFGAGQFTCYALFAWLAPSAADIGVTALPPGVVLGLFTSVFCVATLGTGLLPGRAEDRRGLLALSNTLTMVGMAGLAFMPTLTPIIDVVLVAVGMGMGFTLAMTLPLDNTRSSEQAGAWTVFTLFIGYLTAAFGPLAFGALRDYTGGYGSAYEMLFAVQVFMLCLTPLLKPTRQGYRVTEHTGIASVSPR
ncbi:CynX/NimT family MFS transporter [Pseudomonas putida]|uniref:MFS transporter n=1 Tax=Pseudomonas putida TaxID=303 RepID=UPI00383B92A7